jgi:hypothetical protein
MRKRLRELLFLEVASDVCGVSIISVCSFDMLDSAESESNGIIR